MYWSQRRSQSNSVNRQTTGTGAETGIPAREQHHLRILNKVNSFFGSIRALLPGSLPLRVYHSLILGSVIAFLAPFFITGCGTNVTMIGNPRPAIGAAAVRIYETPPRRYEQIAILNSSAGTTWIFHDQDSLAEVLARLRAQAAAVGANGVLLQEIYDRPVGGLSFGVGGFGFGHHGFYGGSGAVGGPLINRRVQAEAIYVRR
jgi:hypothetical protein